MAESRQQQRHEIVQEIHAEMSPDPRYAGANGLALPRRQRRRMARSKAKRIWQAFRKGEDLPE